MFLVRNKLFMFHPPHKFMVNNWEQFKTKLAVNCKTCA